VVFFGLVALRVLSRGRKRRQRPAPAARSFTEPTASDRTSGTVDVTPGQIPFTGIAPGWLIDPYARHEQRYWSGSAWTDHVLDRGVPGTDPPPGLT
jgi:hypothetical protein